MKKPKLSKIIAGTVLPLALMCGMDLLTPKNVYSQEKNIPKTTLEHKVKTPELRLDLTPTIDEQGVIKSTSYLAEDWKRQEKNILRYNNLNDIIFRAQIDTEKETRVYDFREEHNIKLKNLVLSGNYGINIIVEDASGYEVAKQILNVVPKGIKTRLTNDKQGPGISNVKVGPIEKGLFTETTITWDTDAPSTTFLKYRVAGSKEEKRIAEEVELVKSHSASIHNLQKGKDYKFQVVSEDIFGNETVSEEFGFDTDKVSQKPYSIHKQEDNMAKPAILEATPYLIGPKRGTIGLSVRASEPVKLTVQYIRTRIPKGMDTSKTYCGPVFSESTKPFYHRKH